MKDEIGRAYGTHGSDEKCIQYFGLKGRDCLEDQAVGGGIMLG
jgi:hypothetical protein